MKLVDETATDTLPKLLRRNMQKFGKQTGMREKDRGIWQSYSWRKCYGHVRDFALGLAAAGFKRGDKLSVLGDNRARLYWAQLAAQALGGMSVPLYQDSIASELAYVLHHAPEPVRVLEEARRVSRRLVILEDTYRSSIERAFAAWTDWVLNRGHGITPAWGRLAPEAWVALTSPERRPLHVEEIPPKWLGTYRDPIRHLLVVI